MNEKKLAFKVTQNIIGHKPKFLKHNLNISTNQIRLTRMGYEKRLNLLDLKMSFVHFDGVCLTNEHVQSKSYSHLTSVLAVWQIS